MHPPIGSCGRRHQPAQAAQVECGGREADEPVNVREATEFDLAKPDDRFELAKCRFDPPPRVLAWRRPRNRWHCGAPRAVCWATFGVNQSPRASPNALARGEPLVSDNAGLYLLTDRIEEADRAVASAENVGCAVNPDMKDDIKAARTKKTPRPPAC